jgi:hypothetical protein
MSALTDLRGEVLGNLTNFGISQGRFGWLVAAIDTDDLTFNVDATSSFGEGVIEIDDEQLFVKAFDRNANIAQIAPDGRGWDGTTAASHALNARINIEPLFPKKSVDRALDTAIRRSFPTIWGTAKTTIVPTGVKMTYALPATTVGVLDVQAETLGASGVWLPVRNYSFDGHADLTAYPTGKTITFDGVYPGRDVQVTYKTSGLPLTSAMTLFTETGLQDSARYAIVLGACAHLVRFADPTRLVSNTGAADEYDSKRPYGTATKIANDLEAQFQRELLAEAARLRQLYPATIHRKRF